VALAAIIQGQDAVYANLGVAATWTPSGGEAVPCTALLEGGDDAAPIKGLTSPLIMGVTVIKVRVRELAAATELLPADGDLVSVGVDIDTPLDQQSPYLITGAPERMDPRRLEWTIALAAD